MLARELRHSRKALILLLLFSVALAVPGIIIPAFAKIFVDDVLIERSRGWLVPLLIGMAATAIGRALVTALQQSLLLRLQTKFSLALVSRFVATSGAADGVLHPTSRRRHPSRVAANEQIARLLSGSLSTNALNLVSLAFFAAAMAVYDVRLTVICILIALLNLLALGAVSRQLAEINRGLSLERGKLYSSTIGIVRTIEILKASGLENKSFTRWAGFQAKLLNMEQRVGAYWRSSTSRQSSSRRSIPRSFLG